MSHLDKCAWKLISPSKFTMGISANRCGAPAVLKILRPQRKMDLYLCEKHLNEFIDVWGLHNNVKILITKTHLNELSFGGECY